MCWAAHHRASHAVGLLHSPLASRVPCQVLFGDFFLIFFFFLLKLNTVENHW